MGGDQHPWRAKAALNGVVFHKGLLQWTHVTFGSKPFNGGCRISPAELNRWVPQRVNRPRFEVLSWEQLAEPYEWGFHIMPMRQNGVFPHPLNGENLATIGLHGKHHARVYRFPIH